MKNKNKARIVILGGGNGTSRLLIALLPLLIKEEIASLHAIVHMSDDGGSTGRLRDQYGVSAVGDLTKSLMALSPMRGDLRGNEFLAALEYRFSEGDFQGHTVRNILLVALEKTQPAAEAVDEGDAPIDRALAVLARVLRVPKHAGVVPTTTTSLTEQAVILFNGDSNLLGEGQHSISHRVNMQADPRWQPGDVKVRFAEGDVPLNKRAEKILEQATHIIVAPGHTYGTILPTLALPDLQRVIKRTHAKLLTVMTLLTTPHQTAGWDGEDFVSVYESYLGRGMDVVIANKQEATIEMVEGQDWVRFKGRKVSYRLIEDNLVSGSLQTAQRGDVVPRAVVVHDSARLQKLIGNLLGLV
ncbi:MAG TPA: hypothetical protein DDW41_04705 [Candidatus Andersenbacteria bacterium]|nr:MAG: hypothetical protein UW94_C0001G0079 [Parcubacteria group bacterium GW2011_GWA2_45_14]OGY35774.1 MAG: hypothetical protein A3B76_03615 [Candidatus Andersenbacteria bacterium RIFCSPHIGHO2_02_FULL_46_16]HBE90481.1 hypothetical protein [Candidatus Andersenbacteria bacterium]